MLLVGFLLVLVALWYNSPVLHSAHLLVRVLRLPFAVITQCSASSCFRFRWAPVDLCLQKIAQKPRRQPTVRLKHGISIRHHAKHSDELIRQLGVLLFRSRRRGSSTCARSVFWDRRARFSPGRQGSRLGRHHEAGGRQRQGGRQVAGDTLKILRMYSCVVRNGARIFFSRTTRQFRQIVIRRLRLGTWQR